ncbi:hypothetical protein PtB15_18B418 [Puccinia triticina]|nr:hypothetical protein PtB15_18B418 [Puccinia triticina]
MKMATKLLSFIIIAASYHVIRATRFLPIPTNVVDTSASSGGKFQQLDTVFGFKETNRFRNQAAFTGPAELPRYQHVEKLPHEVFTEGSPLDIVATQQVAWVKNKDYKLLSADTKAEWEKIGGTYNALTDQERGMLKNYMRTQVTRGSPEDKIDLIRVERFMARVNEPMWWKANLLAKADRGIGEDMDLIRIGDILQFGNTDRALKLTGADVNNMFKELDEVSQRLVDKTPRGKPLNLTPLDQPKTNIGGRESLFTTRMTQLTNAALETVPRMSAKDQETLLRVSYWAHGFSPKQASDFAKVARVNLSTRREKWIQLLTEENWEAAGQRLRALKNSNI